MYKLNVIPVVRNSENAVVCQETYEAVQVFFADMSDFNFDAFACFSGPGGIQVRQMERGDVTWLSALQMFVAKVLVKRWLDLIVDSLADLEFALSAKQTHLPLRRVQYPPGHPPPSVMFMTPTGTTARTTKTAGMPNSRYIPPANTAPPSAACMHAQSPSALPAPSSTPSTSARSKCSVPGCPRRKHCNKVGHCALRAHERERVWKSRPTYQPRRSLVRCRRRLATAGKFWRGTAHASPCCEVAGAGGEGADAGAGARGDPPLGVDAACDGDALASGRRGRGHWDRVSVVWEGITEKGEEKLSVHPTPTLAPRSQRTAVTQTACCLRHLHHARAQLAARVHSARPCHDAPTAHAMTGSESGEEVDAARGGVHFGHFPRAHAASECQPRCGGNVDGPRNGAFLGWEDRWSLVRKARRGNLFISPWGPIAQLGPVGRLRVRLAYIGHNWPPIGGRLGAGRARLAHIFPIGTCRSPIGSPIGHNWRPIGCQLGAGRARLGPQPSGAEWGLSAELGLHPAAQARYMHLCVQKTVEVLLITYVHLLKYLNFKVLSLLLLEAREAAQNKAKIFSSYF
ncbi:hypothetical protein GGX14DRAFT_389601 [Mycena pura]|uniref:Uncharacterized protein n=1 Tax=Mycena pura TaxID=153505 RepID=A0AAD6VTX1_9AGAR|nr:hypothetical protein GGX14DRAFT_389601 [Mycena pura]